jgi:hypothetical protein
MRFSLTTRMQSAPGRYRDTFTAGNFSPGGEILESRRDSPENTKVGAEVRVLWHQGSGDLDSQVQSPLARR